MTYLYVHRLYAYVCILYIQCIKLPFFLILLSNDSKREHNVMGHGPQNFQVNNKSKKLNT